MLSYLIFGITYAFACAVQPGPFQTYIISQTVSRGWQKTLPAALSPLVSDGPIIIIVLLLLSQIPEGFVQFLHFAGALFLFYLAYGAYKSWRNYDDRQEVDTHSGRQTLLKAAFVNILNPNPYLGWSLVMGPLFLKGYDETAINGFILIIGFYSTMILCTAGIIILFAFARNIGPHVNRITVGLSVIALACFGIYQLWLGLNTV